MFQAVDAALIRLPAGIGIPIPPTPELHSAGTEAAEAQREWIRAMWDRSDLAAAVELAAPAFADRIEAIIAGVPMPPHRMRRAALTLLRYHLRMSTRATPFGLFAGIAPVDCTPHAVVESGDEHQAVVRLDAVRMLRIATDLEHELLDDLPVVVNNLAAVQGGRLVLLAQTEHDKADPMEVSLRHTPAVEAVLRLAAHPIRFADLASKLAAEFPQTGSETITATLRTMVARGVLITVLRSPMSEPDPLGRLLAELREANTEPAAGIDMLTEARRRLAAVERIGDLSELRAALRRVTQPLGREGDRPELAVDLRVDARVGLPPVVLAEAEHAATTLLRLTRFPSGLPSWRDYHNQFLERYGLGAHVRVIDLTDPVAGLGFPAGYRDALRPPIPTPVSDRDRALLAMAQHAVSDPGMEVDLDAADLADIAVPEPLPPSHVGITFHLRARAPGDLDAGRFTLAVDNAARAVGTTEGRFLHLLEQADLARIAKAWSALPTGAAGAKHLQLSGPPLIASTANVARVPQILPDLLALGEHATARRSSIELADLAVTADVDGLHLVNLIDGSIVEPLVPNAIEPTSRLHPMQRFLVELPRARTSVYGMFDWGAARALPILPRLRSGRSILAPARWRITAGQLPAEDRPASEWRAGLHRLQQRHQLPDRVLLGDSDMRYGIDLDNPSHLELLRDHLRRKKTAVLRESPTEAELGWIGGRAHEISLPLAASGVPRPQQARTHAPITLVTTETEHLPGAGNWLSAKLYSHPNRFDHLLTEQLPTILATWPEPPDWWFIRYRDPHPHLRLRLRIGDGTGYGEVAEQLGTWAKGLRHKGLISSLQLDTYVPETGRFGAGSAMAAAEKLFAVDSAAAVSQVQHGIRTQVPTQVLCAASFIDLAIAFAGSATKGLHWILDHVDRSGSPLDRSLVAALSRIFDFEAARADGLADTVSGQAVLEAWQRRSTAVTAYRNELFDLGQPSLDAALASLLHLHRARAIGVDIEAERRDLRLARAVALTWNTRTRRSHVL